MIDFPWTLPLAGGLLVGTAAALLLWLNGRIAGISNIFGGLWQAPKGDAAWRWAFLLGLLAGGLCLLPFATTAFGPPQTSLGGMALAGLLVGFGTRLGNGCTSGHGVCGLSRRSLRSLAATLTFMLVAMLTVYLKRHVLGG